MIKAGRWAVLWLGLALMPFSACSRQPALLSPPENAQSSLPFDNPSRRDGVSPTQAFASSSIPAGTAIVVRLQSAVSSAESHSGDQFQAVLDAPIVVQGQTLAPGGAAITGTVLAAKASGPGEPGYLRLTLSSLTLKGQALEVHCSSVFSKGGPREYSGAASGAQSPRHPVGTAEVQFSTGRRLSFRLIEPLLIQG